MQVFMMGMANRNKEMKVFDFEKFYNILMTEDVIVASAGLEEDLQYTEGTLICDGKIDNDYYAYLQSTWATPVLMYTTRDNNFNRIECWVMESQAKWSIVESWPYIEGYLDTLIKYEIDLDKLKINKDE